MARGRYALGLDFGTESVRALVVSCETGDEAAEAVRRYPHGVVTRAIPGLSAAPHLPRDFALQHPRDWADAGVAAIRDVLASGRVTADEIAGVGVDFTACTMLPAKADGTPLLEVNERLGASPHAWAKLWKHHAAQPEADRVNEVARERREPFLAYYGGTISSEWMLPKCWEIARRAPEVYAAADLLVDAGDWIVHEMTGAWCRNACAAGYKGLFSAELGFPSRGFLAALDPAIADVAEKWLQNVVAPGTRAGAVTDRFAAASGLRAGTPVSAATIDAHGGVPGMGVAGEGPVSMIMGTSSCHMVLSRELKLFDGFAGVVRDGILPGFYGYESGQAAVGDIFAWFARDFLGGALTPTLSCGEREEDAFARLSRAAAALVPGETGLVALDWLNGCRSPLMDAHLSGLILGLTLDTRPHEVYRALVEATAFGTRAILDSYAAAGIPATELVVCGGLAKDPAILKVYADATGLRVKVAASDQAVALGAAIFGALAAGRAGGGFATVEEAIARMTRLPRRTLEPDPGTKPTYDELYGMYRHASDRFGRDAGGRTIMRRLREMRGGARS